MFDRYCITRTADLEDAFKRTQDYLATVPRERNVAKFTAPEADAR